MSQTYTIHIKDLLVRGRLGLYKEERKLGADFLVNADFTFSGREVRSMQDTVDYARILNLFRVHLAQPAELLEQCLAETGRDYLQCLVCCSRTLRRGGLEYGSQPGFR